MSGRRPPLLNPTPVDSVEGLRKLILPNGLTVYLLHRGNAPLLSARLIFPRGSAASPTGKSGLADLTAQLLRRGTQKRSRDQITDQLESAGTDLGVWVTDDSTRISLTAEPRAAAPLLGLVSELLRKPSFPKREVAAHRERTCDQLQSSLDDAEWIANRATYRAVFPGHPYGVPSEGWVKEVAQLHRRDARVFAEGYTARGAALVLSGAVDGDSLEAWLRPFRLLPKGAPAAFKLAAPAPLRGRQVVIVDKPDATQTQIRIAAQGFRRDAPELVAAVLGNGVLGDGFASRLVNEVRVNRGLTYGISSRFGAMEVGGLFLVRSFTRVEKAAELISVVLDQLAKLRDEGPLEEELRRVRTYLGGAFRLGTETPDQIGSHVADAFRYGLGEDWIRRYPKLLAETPRESVAAALAEHLPLERFRIVAVGPAATLAPKLKRFGPVEVLSLTGIS